MICIRMQDGKIMIARRGKPFFPEPLSRDVVVIGENEEAFLVGPYPEKNVMILPFDRYHEMAMELQNNCPSAKAWRLTALVLLAMFLILSVMYLMQLSYTRRLFTHVVATWGSKRRRIENESSCEDGRETG